MDYDQLRDTTMAVEHRILKKVDISDALLADEIFSMLMGDSVEPDTGIYRGKRAVCGNGLLMKGIEVKP